MNTPQFRSKTGALFTPFAPVALQSLHQELALLGVHPLQIAEAASYSLAMVVRFALGLSAQGGQVCALVKDSLQGAVVLATLRHLVNAGAKGVALLLPQDAAPTSFTEPQLEILTKMGTSITQLHGSNSANEVAQVVSNSHNLILGLPIGEIDSLTDTIITALNELQTPIHTVDAPYGVDLETGVAKKVALFASSTLSLGAPLACLHHGRDYVGRHYLCDISVTGAIYTALGEDLSLLFAEQPVTQIFPVVPEGQ